MIKNDPQLSFSSIDALKHSSVDFKALGRNGKLHVDGVSYRVQMSVDGEFKVQREGRSSVSPGRFFKAAGEMFSHRLNDGAMSSRSARIADVLNAKAWSAERQAPARVPVNANPGRVHPMANHVEPAQIRQPSSKDWRSNILKQIEHMPRSEWEGPIKALESLYANAKTLPKAHIRQLLEQLNSIIGISDSGTRNARLEQFTASLGAKASQGREQIGRYQGQTGTPAARPHPLQGQQSQGGARVSQQPSAASSAHRPLTPEHFMREEKARADHYNERPSERRAEQEYSDYLKRITQQPGTEANARVQNRPQGSHQSSGASPRTQMEARIPQRTREQFIADEEDRARYHGEEPNYGDALRAFNMQPGSDAGRRKSSVEAKPVSVTPAATSVASANEPVMELDLAHFERSEEDRANYYNEQPDYQSAQREFESYQARLKESSR